MVNLLFTLIAVIAQPPRADAIVHVDAARVMNRVSPWMYGSCIEDVNHEIYGGLYSQMIFGESFQEPPSHRPWGMYEMRVRDFDGHTLRVSAPPRTGAEPGDSANRRRH